MQFQDVYPVIVTDKPIECRDFYVRWFNFQVAFEASWFIYLVSSGDRPFSLALISPEHPSKPPEPPQFSGSGLFLTFQVEDAIATYQQLQQAGLTIPYPVRDEPWGQRRFCVQDPIGLWIDVVQQIEPAPGFWDRYL